MSKMAQLAAEEQQRQEQEPVWKRVRKGARDLTPVQLARAKRVGTGGQTIGLVIGMGMLIYLRLWYWLPFLVFTLIVTVVEFVSVDQQVTRIEQIIGGEENG